MARRKAKVVKRPRAIQDIVEIATFIARDSLAASDRFVAATERTFAQLSLMPGMGRVYDIDHPSLGNIRAVPVSRFAQYLVFYHVTEGGVEVLRVIHGAPDIPTLMAEEGAQPEN